MVGREKRSKMMLAYVVLLKGGGLDWLVRQLLRDLRKIGVHGRVIPRATDRTPPWMFSTMSANRGEKRATQQ